MIGELIVFVVSALLFVATEWFFPIGDSDIARKQKHFWSIMLTILSLIIGFDIKQGIDTQEKIQKLGLETQERIANVGSVFRTLTTKEIQQQFQEMFSLYHEHFDHAKDPLRSWAGEALLQLKADMNNGYISIPRDEAAAQISKAYPKARESIIATNVGGTKFYFDNATYVSSNQALCEKGIPSIRFYLYSKSRKIELTSAKGPITPTIDEFFKEVSNLHAALKTVYSVVVDVDKVREPRDLLILDNTFLAETQLSDSWEPIKARATERALNLNAAREYFRLLMGAVDKRYAASMPDEEVKKYFHNFEGTKDVKLGERIYSEVMKSFTQ